jgi:hypothetical protein
VFARLNVVAYRSNKLHLELENQRGKPWHTPRELPHLKSHELFDTLFTLTTVAAVRVVAVINSKSMTIIPTLFTDSLLAKTARKKACFVNTTINDTHLINNNIIVVVVVIIVVVVVVIIVVVVVVVVIIRLL